MLDMNSNVASDYRLPNMLINAVDDKNNVGRSMISSEPAIRMDLKSCSLAECMYYHLDV